MADDTVDIVADEVEKISGLPDYVLLDILGRLAMAGSLGVRSLDCPACVAAQGKHGVAASRLRFAEGSGHVDAFDRALKDGIPTSAQITLILSEPV